MEFKSCLLFMVSLSLAATMINAGEKACAEVGEYCLTSDTCCSGVCLTFRARCGSSSGGAAIPDGYQPPPPIPPLEPFPNQTNCALLGSPCHTTPCCEPFYCGNYGLACKSP